MDFIWLTQLSETLLAYCSPVNGNIFDPLINFSYGPAIFICNLNYSNEMKRNNLCLFVFLKWKIEGSLVIDILLCGFLKANSNIFFFKKKAKPNIFLAILITSSFWKLRSPFLPTWRLDWQWTYVVTCPQLLVCLSHTNH